MCLASGAIQGLVSAGGVGSTLNELVKEWRAPGAELALQEVQEGIAAHEVGAVGLLHFVPLSPEKPRHLHGVLGVHLDAGEVQVALVKELEQVHDLGVSRPVVTRVREDAAHPAIAGHEKPRDLDALPREEARVVEPRGLGALLRRVDHAVPHNEDPALAPRVHRSAIPATEPDTAAFNVDGVLLPLLFRAVVYRVRLEHAPGAAVELKPRSIQPG
mmetsp:Transcript_312/g.1012  ORF Transcript_312/g.1012 Transcript_312/m.1012 type:complete len:216 (-) Transcript_312:617-1264(-)